MAMLGNSNQIIACGELDKKGVRDLLYNSDCLVLASRNEAQPLVLLEAMCTGIPVISTDCIPQSIKKLSGCTVTEIDDVAQLSEAMLKRCSDDNISSKMISSEVVNMVSQEAVGLKLEQVFKNIISSHG